MARKSAASTSDQPTIENGAGPPVFEVRQVPIDQLAASDHNPRGRVDQSDPETQSLAESIKRFGLIHPITVRQVKPNRFVVIAGERRYVASLLAGLKEVPIVIRADVDAKRETEIALAENTERLNLTPFQEGAGVRQLLDAGMSIDSIAIELGRSIAWVTIRAKIANIHGAFTKGYDNPKSPFHRVPLAHLEAIARLSPAMQADVAKWWDQQARYSRDPLPRLTDLREWIDRQCLAIASIPWELDRTDLAASAPACASCPNRASRDGVLFPDLLGDTEAEINKNDRCLDKACHDKKLEAFVQRQHEALKKQHGKGVVLMGNTYEQPAIKSKNIEASYARVECKPTAPAAKPTLIVTGPKAGKTVWTQSSQAASRSRAPKKLDPATGKPAPRPLAERRADLQRKRKASALNKVIEALDDVEYSEKGTGGPTSIDVIRFAAIFGTEHDQKYFLGASGDRRAWAEFDELGTQAKGIAELWLRVRPVLQSRMSHVGPIQGSKQLDERWEEAVRICGLVKLRSEEFLDRATEEIKEPKSWAAEIAARKGKAKPGAARAGRAQ